jgi:hypothetical protein
MKKEKLATKWQNYSIIKTMNFESDMDSEIYECRLKIVLCKDEKNSEDDIELIFFGVSNLKLDEIGGGISQFCRLDVTDIREKQWDRLNYYVFDHETEKISFYCRDFEIE